MRTPIHHRPPHGSNPGQRAVCVAGAIPPRFPRRRQPTSRRSAFTLLELTVVMVIVATLSTLGIVRYAAATNRYRVDAAAARLATDLTLAQNTARYTSSAQTITFNTLTQSYTVSGQASLNNPARAYTVDLTADPYRAAITLLTLTNNATAVKFDGFGTPDQTGTIRLTVGQSKRVITVGTTPGRFIVTGAN